MPGRAACIDRYEASLAGGSAGAPDGKGTTARAVAKKGALPATLISQRQAAAACRNAGKRLCTIAEWTAACEGATHSRKYPYGTKYRAALCNDRARAKRRLLPTGKLPRCRTPEGVYDLSGNVWEWIADTNVTGEVARFLGGGWGNDDDDDNLSCAPEDPLAQPVTQQAEAIGFRCCKDL